MATGVPSCSLLGATVCQRKPRRTRETIHARVQLSAEVPEGRSRIRSLRSTSSPLGQRVDNDGSLKKLCDSVVSRGSGEARCAFLRLGRDHVDLGIEFRGHCSQAAKAEDTDLVAGLYAEIKVVLRKESRSGPLLQSVCKSMPYLRQDAVTSKVNKETDAKTCNDLFPRRSFLFSVDPSNRGRQKRQTNYKGSHKSGPSSIREAN